MALALLGLLEGVDEKIGPEIPLRILKRRGL